MLHVIESLLGGRKNVNFIGFPFVSPNIAFFVYVLILAAKGDCLEFGELFPFSSRFNKLR